MKKLVLHFSQYGRSHAVAISFTILDTGTVLLLLLCFGIINIILILLQQNNMAARQLRDLERRERVNTETFIQKEREIMDQYRMYIQNINMLKMERKATKEKRVAIKIHMKNLELWLDERKLIALFERVVTLFQDTLLAHTKFFQRLTAQHEEIRQECNN
jgi:hypothetical protein